MRRGTLWGAAAAAGVWLAAAAVGCGPIARDRGRAASLGVCGLGMSAAANAHEAGRLAAQEAAAALGPARPRCVLVFEAFPAADRAALLAGVASAVPGEVVFGCSTAGVFTPQGAPEGKAVAVLALGAEGLSMATAVTSVDKADPGLSGEMIARALPKEPVDGVLLLLADCAEAALVEVVGGVKGVKGANETVVGGAAGGEKPAVYFQGRACEKTAVGLALKGKFATAVVSRSAGSEAAHSEGSVTATAREAGRALIAELGAPPTWVVAFSALERRSALTTKAAEMTALREALGQDVPILGCYTPSQIGPPRRGMPALGLERHLVLCGIRWVGPPD